MNRMSDLLTRWLYGNMRQGPDQSQQEGESGQASQDTEQNQSAAVGAEALSQSAENTQTQSGENMHTQSEDSMHTQSAENTQTQVTENTKAQSEENMQTQSGENTQTQSGENTQNQSTDPSVSNHPETDSVAGIVAKGFTVENELNETYLGLKFKHDSVYSDHKTATLSSKGLTVNEPNDMYLGLKSEQDSSDSKSDESQSSFVHKIEAMNVDDSDSGVQRENSVEYDKLQKSNDVLTDSTMEVDTEVNESVKSSNKEKVEFYNPLEPTCYPVHLDESTESEEKGRSLDSEEGRSTSFFLKKTEKTHQGVSQAEQQQQSSQSENLIVTSKDSERLADDSSGQLDEEPPYMVERGVYRETVSAAVDTLRSQNVKPVVSLHYSSEGTSASTIKVGFTQFQSLQEEIEGQNQQTEAQRSDNDDDQINVTNVEHVNNGDGSSAVSCNDINKEKSADINVDNDNYKDNVSSKSKNKVEHGFEIDTSQLVEKERKNDLKNLTLRKTGNLRSENEQGACAMDIDDCDTKSAFRPFSVKTADNEQCLVMEDLKQSGQTENTGEGISFEVPAVSLHVEDLSEDKKGTISEDTSSIERSERDRIESIDVPECKPSCSKQTDTVSAASSNSSKSLDGAESQSRQGQSSVICVHVFLFFCFQ